MCLPSPIGAEDEQSIHSTTLTAWTTAVAANDIFGIQLKTVATAKFAELDIQCNQ